jgi:hypothetical protein
MQIERQGDGTSSAATSVLRLPTLPGLPALLHLLVIHHPASIRVR